MTAKSSTPSGAPLRHLLVKQGVRIDRETTISNVQEVSAVYIGVSEFNLANSRHRILIVISKCAISAFATCFMCTYIMPPCYAGLTILLLPPIQKRALHSAK